MKEGGRSKALAGISTKETHENAGSGGPCFPPPPGVIEKPKSSFLGWGAQGGQRGGTEPTQGRTTQLSSKLGPCTETEGEVVVV